jgi:hypothetical protein
MAAALSTMAITLSSPNPGVPWSCWCFSGQHRCSADQTTSESGSPAVEDGFPGKKEQQQKNLTKNK